jgi:tight adherence protein B
MAAPFLWPARSGTRAHPGGGPLGGLRTNLAHAGFHAVSLPALGLVSAFLGLAIGALCFAIFPVVALAVIAALFGLALPTGLVVWRARSRRAATRMLWPDIVDHLVSAVRSGLALPDSVVTLAHAGPAETRASFAEFERDYRATGNFSDCVDRLKRTLADPVADRILETLRMSREVGGSELTTVLRNLAAYLRQEAAILAEVEARQSWVLNAARLGVASPWVILLILSSRREAAAAYNTSTGAAIIVGGLIVSVAAYRAMLGFGRFRDERRWFD